MLSFQIPAKRFADAIAVVARAASTRETVPAYTGILLEATPDRLTLSAFDTELAIQMDVEASVSQPGAILIPAKALQDLTKRVPPAVTVEVRAVDGSASLRFGRSRFDLPTLTAADFAKLQFDAAESGEGIELEGEDLKGLLTSVSYAAALQDDFRPMLTGVHMATPEGRLEFCATDNFRLAYCKGPAVGHPNQAAIVPVKAFSDLATLFQGQTVRVFYGERRMEFLCGDLRAGLATIDGAFPQFHALFPTEFATTVTLAVDDLAAILDRSMLITSASQAPQVTVKISGDTMVIRCFSERGTAQEEMEVEVVGEDTEVLVNPRFLLQSLRAVKGEMALLGLNGARRPIAVREAGEDSATYALVQPLQPS